MNIAALTSCRRAARREEEKKQTNSLIATVLEFAAYAQVQQKL